MSLVTVTCSYADSTGPTDGFGASTLARAAGMESATRSRPLGTSRRDSRGPRDRSPVPSYLQTSFPPFTGLVTPTAYRLAAALGLAAGAVDTACGFVLCLEDIRLLHRGGGLTARCGGEAFRTSLTFGLFP